MSGSLKNFCGGDWGLGGGGVVVVEVVVGWGGVVQTSFRAQLRSS